MEVRLKQFLDLKMDFRFERLVIRGSSQAQISPYMQGKITELRWIQEPNPHTLHYLTSPFLGCSDGYHYSTVNNHTPDSYSKPMKQHPAWFFA